jgi:hypothetical protein
MNSEKNSDTAGAENQGKEANSGISGRPVPAPLLCQARNRH